MSKLFAIRPVRALLVGVVACLVVLLTATAGSASDRGGATTGASAVARARVAADVLMDSYDPVKAWWPSSWWNSAVALQTIGDYMQRTGDRRYVPELDNTFEKDKGVFPPGVLSGDPLLGNFTSRAIDDSEWWGLTWVEAYDVTGNHKYLDMAVKIADLCPGLLGSEHLRRGRLVECREDLQERGDERPLRPADRRIAQPDPR